MSSVEIASNQLPRGTIVAGKYRVEREIAEGGMGVVLLATQLDLERQVAIKVVRAALASDPVVVERLLMEAKSAAQIRSEHVARVLDMGRLEDGTPFLVMDHLEGRDLASLLESRGTVAVEEAVAIVLQACDALAEAHRAGIVHRDLKPDNLFIASGPDGNPVVKVLDFGISKRITGPGSRRVLTSGGLLVGSPYYMAPEQLAGAGDLDARVDVWALGVILYELLSGRHPFEGASIQEVCIGIVQQQPQPLGVIVPGLPDGLARAVEKCLAKDRSERYSGVDELARAIAPFGDEHAGVLAERVVRIAHGPVHTPERVSAGYRASSGTLEPAAVAASQSTRIVRRRRPATWVVIGSFSVGLLVVALYVRAGTLTFSFGVAPPSAAAQTPEVPVLDELVWHAKERDVVSSGGVSEARPPVQSRILPPATKPAPPKSTLVVPRRRVSSMPRARRDTGSDEARLEPSKRSKDPWDVSAFGGRR